MPREFYAPAREEVAFRDFDRVKLEPHQVRVESRFAAAKHGTELSLFKDTAAERGSYDPQYQVFTGKGTDGWTAFPLSLGNMCVGDVVEIGSHIGKFEVGQRVFGFGGFQDEHVWDEEDVRVLEEGVVWQAAVCLDPADFAVGAIRDGHLRLGDAAAVFGMGALGLMAVQFARLAGAFPVIAIDPIKSRRDVAEACGVDIVLDPTACDVGLEIKKATSGRGADVTIEYSGHPAALQAAIRGTAYCGTVVYGAWAKPFAPGLDFGAEAHFNRIKIVFTRSCSEPNPDHPAWDEKRIFGVAWHHLSSGAIKCVEVVTPVVGFGELMTEYPGIAQPEGNIKLGVKF